MARRGALPASAWPDQEFRARFGRLRASVAHLSDNEADDAVQEAFARAIQRRVPGDLEPWLRTVSRRIAIDNLRRRREYATGAAIDIDRLRPPTVGGPEDAVVCTESVGLIRRALRSLPPRYRKALVVYSEHRDNSVVAARLGLSSSCARSLLCRARMKLRAELDRVGYAASVLLVRLQRWPEHAAAASAAVCVLAAMAGSSAPGVVDGAAGRRDGGSGGQSLARSEAMVAGGRVPAAAVARPPAKPSAEGRLPLDALRKQIDACGTGAGRTAPGYLGALLEGGAQAQVRTRPARAVGTDACVSLAAARP